LSKIQSQLLIPTSSHPPLLSSSVSSILFPSSTYFILSTLRYENYSQLSALLLMLFGYLSIILLFNSNHSISICIFIFVSYSFCIQFFLSYFFPWSDGFLKIGGIEMRELSSKSCCLWNVVIILGCSVTKVE